MLAAKFYGGKDIRVEETPDPEPRAGEAVIEIRASGVCGSDLHRYRGLDPWGGPPSGPRTYGHELAGIVTALGPETEGIAIGQRVAVEPMQLAGCGSCRTCRRGSPHLCPVRRGSRTASAGFAEKDVARVSHLYPCPLHVPFESAALTDLYACAIHASRRAGAGADATAVILGSGPMAAALGQVLRASAILTIVAARRREALSRIERAGAADITVDSSAPECAAAISRLTANQGADVVFEAAGGAGGETLRLALELVAPGGDVVIIGAFAGDIPVSYREANRKEVTIRWSNGYGVWRGKREFQTALDWIAESRVDPARLITHRYPLDEISTAFETAADKARSGAMKVVVIPKAARAAGVP